MFTAADLRALTDVVATARSTGLDSGRSGSYPPFGELHALDDAGPPDLIEGLRAVSRMSCAVIVTAEPDDRAVIRFRPTPLDGTPADFAARGGLELILHGADVCAGPGVGFDPPRDLCDRLRDSTQAWFSAPRSSAPATRGTTCCCAPGDVPDAATTA